MNATEEGNKLIAESLFGNCEILKRKAFPYRHTDDNGVKRAYYIEGLHYHDSYDWLMPVIENIAKDYDIHISWFDGDVSMNICNRSLEGTEIADRGNFTPAIYNMWLTVTDFLNKIKK